MVTYLPSWLEFRGPSVPQCFLPPSTVAQATDEPAKHKREPAVWRPMTAMEQWAAIALGQCRLPPASSTKRLAYGMYDQARLEEPRITDKQAVFLWQFCWTFRRQISDADVKEIAKQRRAAACNGHAVTAQ